MGVFIYLFFTKKIKTLECSAVGEKGVWSLNDERKEMKNEWERKCQQ